MKYLGLLLIAGGFIWGAYLGTRGAENVVPWLPFAAAAGVAVVGVVVTRLASRSSSAADYSPARNVAALSASVDSVLANVTALDSKKTEMHPFELHERIDELFPKDLATFVDSRAAITELYGVQAYAEVMNEFAAGERYLNRVWSASVDCYIEDVHEYLGRAKEQFTHTRDKLRELAARQA